MLYDLGAGESLYKTFFLKYADRYMAVDWSLGVQNTDIDIVADLNKPFPIGSGAADTVVSLSVLEHLCEPQLFLNEAFRILKPGGAIILQVPWQWHVHGAPHDYFRYAPSGLEHLLKRAGFVDITIEPQAGFFSLIALKLNYFSRRFVRGPLPLRVLIGGVLWFPWQIHQILAPLLDLLDRNWLLEAPGYFVTACRPAE